MTTIPTEKKKRHRLTQEDCDTARLLMERRRTLNEIGEIIGVDSSTVGKIRLAGYKLETYLAQRRAMNKKTRDKKRNKSALNAFMESEHEKNDKLILQQLEEEREAEQNNMSVEMYRFCKNMRKEEEERKRAAEVPGQIMMELPEQQTDNPEEDMRNYLLMKYDDSKQMKFQAAMMDKLLKKLDELIEAITRGRQ